MEIDFVVAWVDGEDSEWRKKRELYESEVKTKKSDSSSASSSRYREWDTFKYWFRSIEKNAPWVRYVFLVTDHQIPKFILKEHPKLKIVYHDEFIPSEFLPTFNSTAIELNFHRIEGLSEYFVYFNDDMFLNTPIEPSFFFKKNKPCYEYIERPFAPMSPVGIIQYHCINDMAVVNKHISRRRVLRNLPKIFHPTYGKAGLKNLFMLPWRNFQHFQDNHMPCPFLKSTLAEVWEKEPDMCRQTSGHKFRTVFDINQYVFKYWDLARWNFAPSHFIGGYYCVSVDNLLSLADDIKKSTHPMICVNDNDNLDNEEYEYCRSEVEKAFELRYPEKSGYEK